MFGAILKRWAYLSLLAISIVSCTIEKGNPGPSLDSKGPSPDKPIVGTGDVFSGGGPYKYQVAQALKNLRNTVKAVAYGNNITRFCSGVQGVTPAAAVEQRELFLRIADRFYEELETMPVGVVSHTLEDEDREGNSHLVQALFHYIPNVPGSEYVEIDIDAWRAGEGYPLISHEIVHSVLRDLYDYEPMPMSSVYIQADGTQKMLGVFGYCMLAAYQDLVEYSAEIARDFGEEGYYQQEVSGHWTASAQQSDGKLIVAYTTIHYYNIHKVYRTFVRRLNADGTLDLSFGNNGTLALSVRTETVNYGGKAVQDLVVLADDSFLIAGWDLAPPGRYWPFLHKYDRNGKRDDAFHGKSQDYIDGNYKHSQWFTSITLQADGKIVAGGTTDNGVTYRYNAYRFKADGSPDTSYGGGYHWVLAPPAGSGSSISTTGTMDASGNLLIAGKAVTSGNRDAVGVVRLTSAGKFDKSFGGDGSVIVDFGGALARDTIRSIVIQPDGKIVVAGAVTEGGRTIPVVMRLNEDGSSDTGFGVGGRVFPLDENYSAGQIERVIALSDGRLIAVGSAAKNTAMQGMIVRLLGDGRIDRAFRNKAGDWGVISFGISSSGVLATSLTELANGRFMVGGFSSPALEPDELFFLQFLGNDSE